MTVIINFFIGALLLASAVSFIVALAVGNKLAHRIMWFMVILMLAAMCAAIGYAFRHWIGI